jgi:hypothetical protein
MGPGSLAQDKGRDVRAYLCIFSLVGIILADYTYCQALLAQATKSKSPPAAKAKAPASKSIVV